MTIFDATISGNYRVPCNREMGIVASRRTMCLERHYVTRPHGEKSSQLRSSVRSLIGKQLVEFGERLIVVKPYKLT